MPANITKTGPIGLKGLNRNNNTENERIQGLKEAANLGRHLGNFNNAPVENIGIQAANTGYGNSQYDDNITSKNQFDDINDIRANEQPWYDKIGNGLAKMGGTALTTFLSAFGTPIVGGATAIAEGQFNGLWNNPFSQAMTDIDNYMDENFQNYKSESEQNRDWWQNLGSANFWADDVIKNIGFTLGAAASGSIFGGGLGLAGKAIDVANKASKVGRLGISAASSLFSAAGEGAIEAKNLMNDQIKLESTRLQDALKPQFNAVNAEYTANKGKHLMMSRDGQMIDPAYEKYKAQMSDLQRKLDAGKQEIVDRAESAGNADFLLNIPLLTMSNMIQFGKGFNKSYANAKKVADISKKSIGAGRIVGQDTETIINNARRAAQGTLEDGERIATYTAKPTSKLGYAAAILKNPVAEGSEEMNQQWIQSGAGDYYSRKDPNDYWKAKIGTQAEKDAIEANKSVIDSINTGLNESWLDPKQWEQFAIGALTGAMGIYMPTKILNQDKTKSVFNPLRYGTYEGGIKNSVSDYTQQASSGQKLVSNLNSRVDNDDFAKRLRNQVAHAYYQNEIDESVNNDDKKSAKDAMDSQFATDVEAFVRAGKTDDLRAIYNQFAQQDQYSDDDIDEYIKAAQYTIKSADEDKAEKQQNIKNENAELLNQYDYNMQQYNNQMQIYKNLWDNGKYKDAQELETEEYTQKLQDLQPQVDAVNNQVQSVQGVETSVNPYLDNNGNPIDKKGNPISMEQLRDNVRTEMSDNGKKANDQLNLYLKAANEVNTASQGALSDEQEDYLTFHNYKAKKSFQRSDELIVNNMDKLPITYEVSKETGDKISKFDKDIVYPITDNEDKETDKVFVNTESLDDNNKFSAVFRLILNDEVGNKSVNDQIQRDFNIKNQNDPTSINADIDNITDYNNLMDDINDSSALYMDAIAHRTLYEDSLAHPQKIDEGATKAVEEKQNKETKDKFEGKSAKDIKQDVMDGKIDMDALDDFIEGMENGEISSDSDTTSNVKQVKDTIDKQSSLEGYIADIEDPQELNDATKILKQTGLSAELSDDINIDSFNKFDADSLIDDDEASELLSHGLSQEDIHNMAEVRKANAIDALSNAMEAWEGDIEKEGKIPSVEQLNSIDTKDTQHVSLDIDINAKDKSDNGVKETKGPDSTSTVPSVTSTTSWEATKSSNEYSSLHTPSSASSVKAIEDSQDSDDNSIDSNSTNNGAWRNTTRRFGRKKVNGKWVNTIQPYHELVADKNSVLYKRSKAIYEYLNNLKAFDNVENANEDRIKKGNKIHFKVVNLSQEIFGKPLKDLSEKEQRQSLVVVIVDDKGNTLGDLPLPEFEPGIRNNNPSDEETKLQNLYNLISDKFIQDYNSNYNIKEAFVDGKDGEVANGVHGLNMTFDNGKPLISEIAEVKMGNAPYIEDRNTLNTIANESKFTIGIKISEGKIEKAYKVQVQAPTRSGISGQPYLLLDDSSGRSIPVPFITPLFDSHEMKDTQLIKVLKQAITNLYASILFDGKGQTEKRNEAVEAITSILQIEPQKGKDAKVFMQVSGNRIQLNFQNIGEDGQFKSIMLDKNSNWVDELINQFDGFPIQVSLYHINSTLKVGSTQYDYNKMIGEIANTNLAPDTHHSINSWFVVRMVDTKGTLASKPIKYNNTSVEKNTTTDKEEKTNNTEKINNTVNNVDDANNKAKKLGIINPRNQNTWDAIPDDMKVSLFNGNNLQIHVEGNNKSTRILSMNNIPMLKKTLQDLNIQAKTGKKIEVEITGAKYRKASDENTENANIEKELRWLRKTLPHIANDSTRITFVDNLIDIPESKEKAWGRYNQGIMTLSKLAAKGTVYHEAFHVVTQTILSEEELKNLYQTAKERYNESNEDLLEELLAEDFRKYVEQNERPDEGFLNRIFRKIKEFITNHFKNKDAIDKLFYDINNGKYADYKIGDSKTDNPFYSIASKYYISKQNATYKAVLNDFNQTPVHNRSLAYTKISWNNFVNRWWNKGYRPVGHYDQNLHTWVLNGVMTNEDYIKYTNEKKQESNTGRIAAQKAQQGMRIRMEWNRLSSEQQMNLLNHGLNEIIYSKMSIDEQEQYMKCVL